MHPASYLTLSNYKPLFGVWLNPKPVIDYNNKCTQGQRKKKKKFPRRVSWSVGGTLKVLQTTVAIAVITDKNSRVVGSNEALCIFFKFAAEYILHT